MITNEVPVKKGHAKQEEYDGFYFVPFANDNGLGTDFYYWQYNNDFERGDKVESGSPLGDLWHIILLKQDMTDLKKPLELDECFEAVLLEPTVYIGHITKGPTIFGGCVIRKTEHSGDFVEKYLTKLLKGSIVDKLKQYAEAVGESNGKI